MARVVITEDELISYIKHSDLTNILVEGPNDMIVYNHLEEKIGSFNVKIMPCGGRSTMIEIYKRRDEFNNKNVIFVADQDSWVFLGKPEYVAEMVFTSGYSIENDLYDFGHVPIRKLMTSQETMEFDTIISNLMPWYCSEVSKAMNGQAAQISKHLNQVIPYGQSTLCDVFLSNNPLMDYDQNLESVIKENNFQKLRGKFLFQALLRLLSHSDRSSKYSYDNLLEIALTQAENEHFDRIVSEINSKKF